VATRLDDTLRVAALNETERRAVARIVARLEDELGADLLAVWLYGSRARGEADPEETHHDRRSDIDMMAIGVNSQLKAPASCAPAISRTGGALHAWPCSSRL
jgi:hypothetical protein